jgi:hypothetical protein
VRLRGRQEAGEASEQERACLRLLTPLAKLQTAKQAVAVASEALEGFGGAGYVEDTGLPVWLRDAQVLPIWEGTTNVLSLDTLRAVRDGALSAWLAEWQSRAQALAATPLAPEAALLHRHLGAVAAVVPRLAEAGPAFVEASARSLALVLAALSSALPLCEQAAWALAHGRGEHSLLAARRFVAARIPVLPDPARASELLHEAELLSGVTAV